MCSNHSAVPQPRIRLLMPLPGELTSVAVTGKRKPVAAAGREISVDAHKEFRSWSQPGNGPPRPLGNTDSASILHVDPVDGRIRYRLDEPSAELPVQEEHFQPLEPRTLDVLVRNATSLLRRRAAQDFTGEA